MLPNEAEVCAVIEKMFAAERMRAQRMLEAGLASPTSGADGGGITLRNLDDVTGLSLNLCLGALAKMSKQLRSVMLLCDHGLAHDATTILRTMFELQVLVNYLLRPDVQVERNGQPLTGAQHGLLVASTTEMRCSLYAAHVAFERKKKKDAWLTIPHLANSPLMSDPAAIEEDYASVHAFISGTYGEEWAKTLKERRSYSGASVKDMAYSFDWADRYETLYRDASAVVHSGDVIHFGKTIEDPESGDHVGTEINLLPSTDRVGIALNLGTLMYAETIDLLNKRFGLFEAKNEPSSRHIESNEP